MLKNVAALVICSFAVVACTAAEVEEPTNDNQQEEVAGEDEVSAGTSESALRECSPGARRLVRLPACCNGARRFMKRQRCSPVDGGLWVTEGYVCSGERC